MRKKKQNIYKWQIINMIVMGVKMMNTKEKVKQSIKLAQECVSEIKDLAKEYQQIAFQTTLNFLLHDKPLQSPNEPFSEKHVKHNTRYDELTDVKTFAGFLRRTSAKSHADKTIAIAYFLLNAKSKMAFSKEDIEKEYQASFLPKSKNTSAEINSLIKRGYLMANDKKVDGKTTFTITMDGIAYVEEELMKKNEK